MKKKISFTPIVSEANSLKTKNGHKSRHKLRSMLYKHYSDGRLSKLIENYRVGKPGFANTEQFFAAFLLQFSDGVRWLIYNTTSLRDRIKEQLWDALNIKNIDSSVKKAYLTYPLVADGGKTEEIIKFSKKNKQLEKGEEYTSLDGVIDWVYLDTLIRKKADEYYKEIYDSLTVHELGRKYDFYGRSFERDIAVMMSDKVNLNKYNGLTKRKGFQYIHFAAVMRKFGLKPGEVSAIRATANHLDIGDLPTGGAPKTDVMVGVTVRGLKEKLFTISCKRVSKNSSVSAHQYSAQTFADVLDKNNIKLRDALECFQTAGSFKWMSEKSAILLEKELKPYIEALCWWVVGGHGGAGEEKQKAEYVVAYRASDNAFAVHSTAEYVRLLMNRKSNNKLGTPFSWTMASGERGKSIQLKMPLFF